jgi:hypothetical protein
MFFWVFPRRQYVLCRRFGTMRLPPAFEDGTDTWFRNVGTVHIDAGEIPKRTFTVFKGFIAHPVTTCFISISQLLLVGRLHLVQWRLTAEETEVTK